MKFTKKTAFDFIKSVDTSISHIKPSKGKSLTADDFHEDYLDGTGRVKHKVTLPNSTTLVHHYTMYQERHDDDKVKTFRSRRRDTYSHDGSGANGTLVKQEYFGRGNWNEI